jgi:hypothetical protein
MKTSRRAVAAIALAAPILAFAGIANAAPGIGMTHRRSVARCRVLISSGACRSLVTRPRAACRPMRSPALCLADCPLACPPLAERSPFSDRSRPPPFQAEQAESV